MPGYEDDVDELGTPAERTAPGARASKVLRTASSQPPEAGDVHELLGQMMAGLARLERKVDELLPLRREVHQLRRDVELDRKALVNGASSKAAKHSSNRMAVLVGALFAAYEAASPVLHEIWKGLHK